MQRSPVLAFATALLATACFVSPGPAGAFEGYRISQPLVHDNLAVYFVRGQGTGAPAALTLDSAVASGAAKVHETGKRPLVVENLSGQNVFIQLGALLKGGLQDQVARTSLIVPPGSARVPLDVFCVDPFRSAARSGEDPKAFSAVGDLLPWQMARLSMVAGSSDSKTADRLRQLGVWWSLDTIRTGLTRQLGQPPEPPQPAEWTADASREAVTSTLLEARRSPTRTSLPLALESEPLAKARRDYVEAPAFADSIAGDVIGAVFSVNGGLIGAEVYGSNALFRQMWPQLLRAYATEAIATRDANAQALPTVDAVSRFLEAAHAGRERALMVSGKALVRDSETAIYSEIGGPDGSWVHRSYMSKLAAGAGTPEATVVAMLETGEVNGRAIGSLDDRAMVVLHANLTGDGWSSTIRPGMLRPGDLERPHEWRPAHSTGSGPAATGFFALISIGWLVFLLASILREAAIRTRRSRWHARAAAHARAPTPASEVIRRCWTYRVSPAWRRLCAQVDAMGRGLERHGRRARIACERMARTAAERSATPLQRAPLLKAS